MSLSDRPSWTNKDGWERGDDAEKYLKDQSQAVSRANAHELIRQRAAVKIKEIERTPPPKNADERGAWLENIQKATAKFEFLNALLSDPNSVLSETFQLRGDAVIVGDAIENDPSIAGWAVATGKAEAGNYFTPDDLLRAAAELAEEYPEVLFKFPMDPKGEVFSYSARLK